MEARWYPVEEKLPNNCTKVLVTIKKENEHLISCCYSVGDRWFDAWNCDVAEYGLSVVAWMPLPEPYKVVEKEKPKTRAERFYEIFPNCKKSDDKDGARRRPSTCWDLLVGVTRLCVDKDCFDCWNEPYGGEFEEAKDAIAERELSPR